MEHSTDHHSILPIDDHPMIRSGLPALIEREPRLCVCGKTGSSREALELISALAPTVCVLDLSLPDASGLPLVSQVASGEQAPSILVYSMFDESRFSIRANKAGASGYLSKREPPERILDAFRQVLSGRICFSGQISDTVFKGLQRGEGTEASDDPIQSLSNREFEVFRLIGEGLGASEIAERLYLSPKSVETHRRAIKRKLQLGSGDLRRCAGQRSFELYGNLGVLNTCPKRRRYRDEHRCADLPA